MGGQTIFFFRTHYCIHSVLCLDQTGGIPVDDPGSGPIQWILHSKYIFGSSSQDTEREGAKSGISWTLCHDATSNVQWNDSSLWREFHRVSLCTGHVFISHVGGDIKAEGGC